MRPVTYDVEGIFTINDIAAELYRFHVGRGYNALSNWVVSLWGLRGDDNFKAGDTPRMILPILLAHGVGNKDIEEFSGEEVNFIPGSKKTLKYILRNDHPAALISVCYKPYMDAVCNLTGFPKENVYCTELPDMNKIKMSETERLLLQKYAEEIARMDVPKWSKGARCLDDVDINHRDTIERLDQMYNNIYDMDASRLIHETEIVGGPAKTEAMMDFVRKKESKAKDTMFTGDSIADVNALRDAGLGVAFNGTRDVIECSDVAIISNDTLPQTVVAETYQQKGKKGVLELAEAWDNVVTSRSLPDFGISDSLSQNVYNMRDSRELVMELYPLDNTEDHERIIELSGDVRNQVRGKFAGTLV